MLKATFIFHQLPKMGSWSVWECFTTKIEAHHNKKKDMTSYLSLLNFLTWSHDFVEVYLQQFTDMNKSWLVIGMTKFGFSLGLSYIMSFIFRSLPNIPNLRVIFSFFHILTIFINYTMFIEFCEYNFWNVDSYFNI